MTAHLHRKFSLSWIAIVLFAFTSLLGAANPEGESLAPNSILYADQFPGSDDGARIVGALAACVQRPTCIVDARNLTERTASEPIVIARPNVTLLMPAGEFTLAGSPGILISAHGV